MEKQRRLIITRTAAARGLIYRAVSADKTYSLGVEFDDATGGISGVLESTFEWILTFESSTERTIARMRPDSPDARFFWQAGGGKGSAREALFSIAGKYIVEDEDGSVLGWIHFGLRMDRMFLGNGVEIGFFRRCYRDDLPAVLPPSKAHWMDRFELVHEPIPEFDDRLLYAFICRQVFAERSGSAS
jgi:hypothetical protein